MTEENLIEKIRREHIDPFSEELVRLRAEVLDRMKNVGPGGVEVKYLGTNFWVPKGVFWPHDDSKPLVENYQIYPGEIVLDVCTGSGCIAVNSVNRGARKVVALDVNPMAVKATIVNAYEHECADVVDARVSDVFSALKPDEKFDVVTMNPPFTVPSANQPNLEVYDAGFYVHKSFFAGFHRHLEEGGRIYLAQSNFGNAVDMLSLAESKGLSAKLIGERSYKADPRKFYAFELKRGEKK